MRLSALLILWLVALPALSAPVLEHQLRVTLKPQAHALAVTDTIVWPKPPAQAPIFVLHAGLNPKALKGAKLKPVGRVQGVILLERYRLELEQGTRQVTLSYGGRLHHPLDEFGEGVGRSRQMTPGYIAEDGVYLGGGSGWVPFFGPEQRVTFSLDVEAPGGWSSISQGAGSMGEGATMRWTERLPQDQIYLMAGPFHVSRQPAGPAEAQVYLREKDPQLAQRYLDATSDYLELFSELMGEYPYAKFALVENFWETGYGMPSFTLLGPRVLRLPFILYSSYPHEILHNWWGNGVFVDYETGNWSEGLTAYMADHLLKERKGEGAEYRRDQLQKYAEYVSGSRDFPLQAFTSRHSGASQAIGYGKSLMLFHMLRLRLGDEVFLEGLRHLYREHRFTEAAFADVRRSFEAVSGKALSDFFRHWVERPGAPRLNLEAVETEEGALNLTLTQKGPGKPFPLQVPVVVRMSDGTLDEHRVSLDVERSEVSLPLSGEPQCVAIDPRFDLFRRLLPGEIPVSLDSLLGADSLLLVVPAGGPDPMRRAYQRLAEGWSAGNSGVSVRADDELESLPTDRPVWLLGWTNRFRNQLAEALDDSAQLASDSVELEGRDWPQDRRSFVLTASRRGGAPIAWMAADTPAAVPGLARKVPHYGNYGYLGFTG
ncbi:M1 family metallopeptidase, partial [Thiohalomonas denitrificans]|uniref:M1 family metallopeptidase n=1 Tax=Thiohalomonas denitrificans TaxID=415747 RepID=UPI0026F35B24